MGGDQASRQPDGPVTVSVSPLAASKLKEGERWSSAKSILSLLPPTNRRECVIMNRQQRRSQKTPPYKVHISDGITAKIPRSHIQRYLKLGLNTLFAAEGRKYAVIKPRRIGV